MNGVTRIRVLCAYLIVCSLLYAQVHPFPGGAPFDNPLIGIDTTGLVAFWDLSTPYLNAETRQFHDLSGTGNNIFRGISSGPSPTYDPVVDANYTDFTSQGMRCDMPGDSASLSITGDLTIEVVMAMATTSAYRHLVHKGITGAEFDFVLNSSSKPYLARGGTAAATATNAVPGANTWTSLAVTVTAGAVKYYMNGAANGTGTVPTPTDSTNIVTLAVWQTYYYTGKMARVRIYNNALSAAAIASNYARDKIVLAPRGIALP